MLKTKRMHDENSGVVRKVVKANDEESMVYTMGWICEGSN